MTYSLITAGGTIDKIYGTGVGTHDLHVGPPVTRNILAMLNMPYEDCVSVCQKDSLHMTREDREQIYRAVFTSMTDRILIVHGTDSLLETAKGIKELADFDTYRSKRIVLVGASQPACIVGSDASARIGFALGILLSFCSPGIIIAMDGIHTNLATCVKDADGIFRS